MWFALFSPVVCENVVAAGLCTRRATHHASGARARKSLWCRGFGLAPTTYGAAGEAACVDERRAEVRGSRRRLGNARPPFHRSDDDPKSLLPVRRPPPAPLS